MRAFFQIVIGIYTGIYLLVIVGNGYSATKITRPPEGESLIAGTLQVIMWDSSLPKDRLVNLIAYYPGGQFTLAERIPNTGNYTLKMSIPDVSPSKLKQGVHLAIIETKATIGSNAAVIAARHLLLNQPVIGTNNISTADKITSSAKRSVSSLPPPTNSVEKIAQPISSIETISTVDQSVQFGSLAGFSYNGTVEEYYWIDVISGDLKVVGTVGDLYSWSGEATIDNEKQIVYVKGMNSANIHKIYSLDAYTGDLLGSPSLDNNTNISGLRVNGDGELIGFAHNGTTEILYVIDPITGHISQRGQVGDLYTWNSETVIDSMTNLAYVLGRNTLNESKIYTINTKTGKLVRDVLLDKAPFIYGLDINTESNVIGCRWNDGVEEFVRINPITGETTKIGEVGDLQYWSGVTALNKSNNLYYVIGLNGSSIKKLYVIDSITGKLMYDLAISQYPATTILVQ